MEAPTWVTQLIEQYGVEEASRDWRFERWLDQRPDLVLETLDASTWTKSIRQPQQGPLSIEATAAVLDIPISYDLDIGYGLIIGLGDEAPQPLLIRLRPNQDTTEGEQRLGFAHEVGHYFVEKIAHYHIHTRGTDNIIERLVEHFGREMVLPSAELSDVEAVDKELLENIRQAYGADLQTVIYQLMVAGKLPAKVAIDTRIPSWVANKELAGTIERRHICLACEFSGFEECLKTEGVPLFDYTETEDLSDKLSAHNDENYDPQKTRQWLEEFTGKSWEEITGKNQSEYNKEEL